MWRFKPFMPKEQAGLEGRTIDIGNLKIQVRNAIAEGGFSCVYLARDAIHGTKQYALKHIICNDEESLELVMREISVMKLLKGHPNVVPLCAHTIFDMGRTKEALLVMDYCEKSLVTMLDNRGAGFLEEKQIFTIFRDVCNAVFAMHCQSPPIAHRDLKAENLLLGPDGLWKLCDFGSTSTNHKRFEKPEEMGIEEDNIRKHTTPAYRAPEMWDLFRRDIISEKVDIWALGCLLYRICYLKSAFDGESKLQVLNGNYRIPELPKYCTSLTDLIRDMLQSSPDSRPDITQVWFRVNSLLPEGLQKSLPDRPPEMDQRATEGHEGIPKPTAKTHPMPRRNPPPPPSAAEPARNSQTTHNSRPAGSAGPLGAFWSSQHAKDSYLSEDNTRPKFDEELTSHFSSRNDINRLEQIPVSKRASTPENINISNYPVQKNVPEKVASRSGDGSSNDFEINLFNDNLGRSTEGVKAPKSESTAGFPAFTAFVAEFGDKLTPQSNSRNLAKEELLQAEIEKLKEQVTQINVEKAEITSKYEKLSAICRSQRQEIHELKQALAARTPSPKRESFKTQASFASHPSTAPKEKIEGTVWELQQGLLDQSSTSPDPRAWQAFADDPPPLTSVNSNSRSVRTRNGRQTNHVSEVNSGANTWGFGTDNFKAAPAASSHINAHTVEATNSQRFSERKDIESSQTSQPAGWAGF
ncbi:probable serine/threonine-protein kinase DDB_G0280111 [Coffea eugenioides]|uniref:probable serine/threonine-protein kinase DDB_G0280111 n=1 Tax=Coffea eugenioides TaxID=49369 RepID=UPI000F612480|nr:probable serine/threonine-protein kinase DDB_G0280111 [Coffea eugenioides]